jgi:hypothetical protein
MLHRKLSRHAGRRCDAESDVVTRWERKGGRNVQVFIAGLFTAKRLCLFCVLAMSRGFDKLTGLYNLLLCHREGHSGPFCRINIGFHVDWIVG